MDVWFSLFYVNRKPRPGHWTIKAKIILTWTWAPGWYHSKCTPTSVCCNWMYTSAALKILNVCGHLSVRAHCNIIFPFIHEYTFKHSPAWVSTLIWFYTWFVFMLEIFTVVWTGTLGVRGWIHFPLRMCIDPITGTFQVRKTPLQARCGQSTNNW